MGKYSFGAVSSVLGTREALGSPLLNSDFEMNDWNKWEIVAFGVFLSNFTYPLVDDYKSAFSLSGRGSNGQGLRALEFSSSPDDNYKNMLHDLLNYMLANQSSNLRRLKVKKKVMFKGIETTFEDSYKDANFNDMFLINDYNFYKDKDNPWIVNAITTAVEWITNSDWKGKSEGTLADLSGYPEIKVLQEMVLPELAVELPGGSYETVFSYSNGWDIQMFNAWIGRVINGNYKEQALKNFEAFVKENTPLYLDSYGNIVAYSGNIPYVVFPAAANCHITQTPQYNLLQGILIGGSYSQESGGTFVNNGWSKDGYAGLNAFTGSNLTPGKVVVLFDSDTLLINRIKYSLGGKIKDKGTVSGKIDDYGLGDIWDSVLKSEFRDSVASMPFRVELINGEGIKDLPPPMQFLAIYTSSISNIFPVDNTVEMLDYVQTPNGKLNIFGKPYAVAVNTKNQFVKRYVNYVYETLYGSSGKNFADANAFNSSEATAKLKEAKNPDQIACWAFTFKSPYNYPGEGWEKSQEIGPMLKSYVRNGGGVSKKKGTDLSGVTLRGKNELLDYYDIPELEKGLGNFDGEIVGGFRRIVKVYPFSDVINAVNAVISLDPGTDMSQMSPWIYATYLKFYGVTKGGAHKFNAKLFDENSDLLKFDIQKAAAGKFLSEEEKKKSILDYTYMLLHPLEGAEYRLKMMMDGLVNWAYKLYNNIVYGGAVEIFKGAGNIGIRSGNGFLYVNTLSDNFITKWFVEKYSEYIVIILGICLIIIVITGIILQKQWIWYITSVFLVVNVLLLFPAFSEITPYIVNNFIDNMFKDKMSYWTVGEAVANANIAKQSTEIVKEASGNKELSSEEARRTANLARMLNVLYLDRALMIKLDISKKIVEGNIENFEDIQNLYTTRWMLPILIRQFSGKGDSKNYIYTPLGDEYENMENLYVFWSNLGGLASDASNTVGVAIANRMEQEGIKGLTVDEKRNINYGGYIDTSYGSNYSNGKYNNLALNTDNMEEYIKAPGWQSVSRVKGDEYNVHTYSYLLPNLFIPKLETDKKGRIDWDEYLKNNKDTVKDSFFNKAAELEQEAWRYNSWDYRTVTGNYGYLWYTQNPLHYFYQVVKDTFKPGSNVAQIAGELQGVYKLSNVTGKEERVSFMHYSDTGKIRDFLDMEELFSNVIPYLYSVQILAGGKDMKSGVLGDSLIESYQLYENNYKSWLFRSNWVSKLMESDLLTSPCTVRDRNGKKYTVENPMIASMYPAERPMVFSEAQMYAMGLRESDLSLPELKILNINRNVERKWTLLLNYANLKGISADILCKQMALDALLEFDKEFSNSSLLNSRLSMYPISVDLRGLSFDSVLKMIMLNATKDIRYIYGDTMKKVIENSDLISIFLIMIDAFLCAYVIPFMRDLGIGILFYLGIIAVLINLSLSKETKVKISVALIVNNIIYAIITLGFYAVFSMLIGLTYKDNILDVKDAVISAGNPVWAFLIILLVSCLYIWFLYRMIKFTIVNYRDLGFEVYAVWAGAIANKIGTKLEDIKGAIGGVGRGLGDLAYEGAYGGSGASSIEGVGVNVKDIKAERVRITEEDIRYNNVDYDSAYIFDFEDEHDYGIDFDKEIERGKGL